MHIRKFGLAIAIAAASATGALAQSSGDIDYANATPMALPTISKAPSSLIAAIKAARDTASSPVVIHSPSVRGDGLKTPVKLPKHKGLVSSGTIGSQEYGTSQHPFTTALEAAPQNWPYSPAGKLFFKVGSNSAVCSASLIGPGIVITAAHCVSDYGKDKYFKSFEFVPAYSDGDAPFGVWTASKVYAPKNYLKGKSKCAVKGVVCDTDIAIIILKPQGNRYPGTSTGWYGWGTNGYSYTNDGLAQITQLGYPVSLNNGQEMMRTDSYGYVDNQSAGNTVIGSGQTGGSSGGPWLVNFGVAPDNSSENPDGADPERMIVVGTTSWGFNDGGQMKQQGASFFAAKIVSDLVNKACKATPSACPR